MQRWRDSQLVQIGSGAFAVALGGALALVAVVALLTGLAVIGALIVEVVR